MSSKGRALPIDHLRATLILLVVAHHAVLAYVSFAPTPEAAWNAEPMIWRAFPIVDVARAPVLDLLVAFNDAVLMALLFFLAGLFTWRGLKSKGAAGYLRGRARRLVLPFIVCAGALAPLAYYPAYLQHGGDPPGPNGPPRPPRAGGPERSRRCDARARNFPGPSFHL